MKRILVLCGAAALVVVGVAAAAPFKSVKPGTYDPKGTKLARASWQIALGCPTDSRVTYDGSTVDSYTDPACETGGPDSKNYGLLLVKTGPTGNYASAFAVLKNVPSSVTELGYDLRKAGGDQGDPRGSHCGAGAPRFNVTDTTGATYFVGCNSTLTVPTVADSSDAWLRLRWSTATDGTTTVALSSLEVKSIAIVLDEGTDTGPDNVGLAVLDNIDIDGTMVGKP
jgi:hypothetical protein